MCAGGWAVGAADESVFPDPKDLAYLGLACARVFHIPLCHLEAVPSPASARLTPERKSPRVSPRPHRR